MGSLKIENDITKAQTLDSSFYMDPELYEKTKENIFIKTWHVIASERDIPFARDVYPVNLLEGFIDEPLLLTKDQEDNLHCMSNVCTHRGNLLIKNPAKCRKIVCDYHGRRFSLDGSFEYMPEFKEAQNFPSPCEDLPKVPFHQWGGFVFASMKPTFDVKEIIKPLEEKVGFLPLKDFRYDKNRSKEYLVNANWALYCDNYLEGFHIPFVHPDLNQTLEFGEYQYDIYPYSNLQTGYGKNEKECFELPEGHPDHGKHVAAYYFWVFPNMMFNFYPWGLSLNIVRPIGIAQTKVSFLTFIYDEKKLGQGAGALLDKVEREDEFVVENVQRGVRSRLYQKGRFSPKMEVGVHHFHRLISEFLNN